MPWKSALAVTITGVFLLFAPLVVARLVHPTEGTEKVANANIIVIAVVEGEGKPSQQTWVLKTFYRLHVLRVLKGESVPRELKMVTGSLGGEWRPNCCVPTKRYLLFLTRGYPVFEDSSEDKHPHISLLETDQYVSSSDGAFGAYELVGRRVLGWPERAEQPTRLADVVSLIRKETPTTPKTGQQGKPVRP